MYKPSVFQHQNHDNVIDSASLSSVWTTIILSIIATTNLADHTEGDLCTQILRCDISTDVTWKDGYAWLREFIE